jgi:hypothetical protein
MPKKLSTGHSIYFPTGDPLRPISLALCFIGADMTPELMKKIPL